MTASSPALICAFSSADMPWALQRAKVSAEMGDNALLPGPARLCAMTYLLELLLRQKRTTHCLSCVKASQRAL